MSATEPYQAKHGHDFTVALAGNPNSGKTTIFNELTGHRQHVGNYAGVTVEIAEGHLHQDGSRIRMVDLPGTYSLTAYTEEELVARKFITGENVDLVVHVVDASNLERNLYLATQLMELRTPMVIVFNMSDIARSRGYIIDVKILSQRLGVPIVETVASKGRGIDRLKQTIVDMLTGTAPATEPRPIRYGREIENQLKAVESLIDESRISLGKIDSRWLALKLIEQDPEANRIVAENFPDSEKIMKRVALAEKRIHAHLGDSPEILIADRRYGFVSGACQEAVESVVEMRHSMSDRIDAVLINEVVGIPIFLALMYFVFKMTFTIGDPLMSLMDMFFSWVAGGAELLFAPVNPVLASLLADGVIRGVGSVLVFLPNILLLYLAIAFLEDSGYMARAAFIMDRLMHKIGLHGKSFIPMVIAFGCTVPAILATRTLETRRGRLTTMLVLPLISCGARLPIYTLFISAFFPKAYRAPILFLIYFTGIAFAVLAVKLLRSTVFKGEAEPFVMELPPYRLPTIKGVLIHTWERGWLFLRKAGTIILTASIILWVLITYPKPPEEALRGLPPAEKGRVMLSYSFAGKTGAILEPVMRHAGFDWKTSTALIGALAGKELFVAQLGILNSIGREEQESGSLRRVLKRDYTPLQAVCIMLFCLLSVPCVATLAATWKESGSWKWAALQVIGLTLLAYCTALVVFQTGRLIMSLTG